MLEEVGLGTDPFQVKTSHTCWVDRNRAVIDFSVRNHFTLSDGDEDEDSIRLQIKKSTRWGKKSRCPPSSPILPSLI